MPRALLAAILALASPATPCNICRDPGSEPAPSQAARDPYDLRSPAPLTAEEMTDILALEGGRYGLKGNHVTDAKAADPAGHLVTNEWITAFLTERTSKETKNLQRKWDEGTFDAADRLTAIGVYWHRGPLLQDPQREFLAMVAASARGKAPNLPGGFKLPPSGPPPVIAAGADPLIDRFRLQLELIDHDKPEEAAGLDMAIRRLMTTPTGRELAQEFIAEGKKVRVSFEPVANSEVIEVNGKKVLHASGGNTAFEGAIPHVRLNKDYLATDPDFMSSYLPGTLTHELLGHALMQIKAVKAGVGNPYLSYRSNESNAGMVGWLVDAELGVKLQDPFMWNFLSDPEEYHRKLKTNLAYYAGTFSPAEMADPIPVLRERKAGAQKAMADNDIDRVNMEAWRPVIAHFKDKTFAPAHGFQKPDSAFRSVSRDLKNFIDSGHARRKTDIQEIIDHVDSLIKWYSGKDGKKEIQAMRKAAGSEFFTQAEITLELRRRRLEAAIKARSQPQVGDTTSVVSPMTPLASTASKGRGIDHWREPPPPEAASPEPFAPPEPGQLTWDELKRLHSDDLGRFPAHWPAI